jgi:hypothetical protein
MPKMPQTSRSKGLFGEFAGNTHCHPHSVAALGYLRAIAVGNDSALCTAFDAIHPPLLYANKLLGDT